MAVGVNNFVVNDSINKIRTPSSCKPIVEELKRKFDFNRLVSGTAICRPVRGSRWDVRRYDDLNGGCTIHVGFVAFGTAYQHHILDIVIDDVTRFIERMKYPTCYDIVLSDAVREQLFSLEFNRWRICLKDINRSILTK